MKSLSFFFHLIFFSGLPIHVEPMLRDTLKEFVILPHRDKYGRRIVLLKVISLFQTQAIKI